MPKARLLTASPQLLLHLPSSPTSLWLSWPGSRPLEFKRPSSIPRRQVSISAFEGVHELWASTFGQFQKTQRKPERNPIHPTHEFVAGVLRIARPMKQEMILRVAFCSTCLRQMILAAKPMVAEQVIYNPKTLIHLMSNSTAPIFRSSLDNSCTDR